tara:strand:- start:160776 stop:161699 length:924 start_codon:yes stop_codon:yes gene_type:complete
MLKNKLSFLFAILFITPTLYAQDDLLESLESEEEPEIIYAFATFKGTKVVNLQSPELPHKGVLQYVISHRFGSFNDDFLYNFAGLDNAQIRMSFDYSVLDWLNVGVSHASFRKMYDGFVKYRLARQSKGAKNFPITITGFSGIYYQSLRFTDGLPHNETERYRYVNQLVLARKFNSNFSAAITPTHVHNNIVDLESFDNSVFAIGLGARYKFTPMHALNIEYIHQLNPYTFEDADGNIQDMRNSLSIGFDIETGGHVFQLFLTNSQAISEPLVISDTQNSWLDGDIHFGFNISRVFTIKRPKLPSEN